MSLLFQCISVCSWLKGYSSRQIPIDGNSAQNSNHILGREHWVFIPLLVSLWMVTAYSFYLSKAVFGNFRVSMHPIPNPLEVLTLMHLHHVLKHVWAVFPTYLDDFMSISIGFMTYLLKVFSNHHFIISNKVIAVFAIPSPPWIFSAVGSSNLKPAFKLLSAYLLLHLVLEL